MKNIIKTLAVAAIAFTTQAGVIQYDGFTTSNSSEPLMQFSVNGSAIAGSGGINLASWWVNPFVKYFVRATVTGNVNGKPINRTWTGIPENNVQTTLVPITDVKYKPGVWVRKDVYYWDPTVVPTKENSLYHTRQEVYGNQK